MQAYLEFVKAHPMLSVAWVGLLIAVVIMSVKIALSKVKTVDSQQLTMMLNNENAKVIDVRSKEDFKKGHIVSAINIPLADIKANKVDAIEKFKSTPIILVCDSGVTSSQAANMLDKKGFENLSNLKGGMSDWTNANMPVQRSKR